MSEEQELKAILAEAVRMSDAEHRESIRIARRVIRTGQSYPVSLPEATKLAKCYLALLKNIPNEPMWVLRARLKVQTREALVSQVVKAAKALEDHDDGGARPPSKADNKHASPPPAKPTEEGEEEGRQKRKFKVVVEWLVSATVEVDAECIEQAIEDVGRRPDLPDEGSYVDGSWRVIEEFTYDENERAPEPAKVPFIFTVKEDV